ncbi:Protein CBG26314 [Caenorhabditis briggsae]
MYFQI